MVVVLCSFLSCLVSIEACFDFVLTNQGPATSNWRERPGTMVVLARWRSGFIRSLPRTMRILLHLKQSSWRVLKSWLADPPLKWKYFEALVNAVAGEDPQHWSWSVWATALPRAVWGLRMGTMNWTLACPSEDDVHHVCELKTG